MTRQSSRRRLRVVMGLTVGLAVCALAEDVYKSMDSAEVARHKAAWRSVNYENQILLKENEKLKATSAGSAQAVKPAAETDAEIRNLALAIKKLSDRAYRAWTGQSGAQIMAQLVADDGRVVKLLKEDGTTVSVKREGLSAQDNTYLGSLGEARRIADTLEREAADKAYQKTMEEEPPSSGEPTSPAEPAPTGRVIVL